MIEYKASCSLFSQGPWAGGSHDGLSSVRLSCALSWHTMDGGVCPVSSVYMAPLGTVYWAVLRLTRWTVESVLCPWKVLSLHGAPSRPQFTGPPTWTGTSMGPWGRACLAVSQAAGIPQAHCLLPTLAQAARTMDTVVSGLSRLVHLIVLSLSQGPALPLPLSILWQHVHTCDSFSRSFSRLDTLSTAASAV